jgi:aminoglycoside phosphotransferase (APT) family kinase protein
MRDLVRLAEGLRRKLANGAAVTGVSVLSAGHSNETYLVHGIDQILRMPPSGAPLLPLALNVRQQFDLYAVLKGREGAPPVPTLSFVCDDPEVLGAPFFLMDRVDGAPWADWEAPEWAKGEDDAFRAGISHQAIAMIANLHRMAPLDGLGPILDNRGELERWRRNARDVDLPELHALFAVLDDRAPPLIDPAPCHGDPKLANMLWCDGRLAAVLDWELAFNGDPRWDIAYMVSPFEGPLWAGQPGLDMGGLWRRDEMIARWREASGRSSADYAWFEAAIHLKVASIIGYGHHMVQVGLSDDPRFASWMPATLEYIDRARRILEADHA